MATDRDEAIAHYLARGWPVLPLHGLVGGRCTCSRDCRCPGKHPRLPGGYKGASLDPGEVSAWWSRWPDGNVGIATGAAGLLVVDVDPRNGGRDTLTRLRDLHRFPPTWACRTGGGGLHIYYVGRGPSRGNGLGPGVDIKGTTGHIVAPPSLHASGRCYQWAMRPGDGPAAAPHWLLAALAPRPAPPRTYALREEGADMARLADALRHVPADDRDTWVRVGMALHHESGGGGDGYDLWCRWSSQSSKYRERDQSATWRSFGGDGGAVVTAGSIVAMARDSGWRDPLPDPIRRAVRDLRWRYSKGRRFTVESVARRHGVARSDLLARLRALPPDEAWAHAVAAAAA